MLHLSHLDVWYLGDKHKYENKLSKLVTIKYSKNDYVRCSAISPDGTWVVYSTEEKLKIFSLIMVRNIFFFIDNIMYFSFNLVLNCSLHFLLCYLGFCHL
jgi:hypothetical protein